MPAPRPQPPIAVTMGETAGVGVEIVLKSWLRYERQNLSPFFLIADPDHVEMAARSISERPSFKVIERPEQALEHIHDALPVLPLALAAPVRPGELDEANAPAVIAAIDQAVALAISGEASAVVTAPIQKSTLYAVGFRFPGHTEYLAHLCGIEGEPVMMLSCPGLRSVPVTIHSSLHDALEELTEDLIVERSLVTAEALRRDFGYPEPRLALAGLNPHAGEKGELGREDIDIIQPAIRRLKAAGLDVSGPHPADSMFHAKIRETYDAAICMYHDQALIPVKTMGFEIGINITLGLPIVRTSPDHGTALPLAGKGRADPASMVAAIGTAGLIARRRLIA